PLTQLPGLVETRWRDRISLWRDRIGGGPARVLHGKGGRGPGAGGGTRGRGAPPGLLTPSHLGGKRASAVRGKKHEAKGGGGEGVRRASADQPARAGFEAGSSIRLHRLRGWHLGLRRGGEARGGPRDAGAGARGRWHR